MRHSYVTGLLLGLIATVTTAANMERALCPITVTFTKTITQTVQGGATIGAGAFTTLFTTYQGPLRTITLAQPSGNTPGTVLVESPAVGQYRTLYVPYPGTTTKTVTVLQPIGTISGLVIVETPIFKPVGQFTTLFTSYGGATTQTITIATPVGGNPGTIVIETPASNALSTTTVRTGASAFTSTVPTIIGGIPTTEVVVNIPLPTITQTSGPVGFTSTVTTVAGGSTVTEVVVNVPTVAAPTSTCVTSVAPAQSACAKSLPAACQTLASIGTIALQAQLQLCKVALGAFATLNPAVTACFSDASGTDALTCLTSNICITSLPQSCARLEVDTTAQSKLADSTICIADLGPLALGLAASCFPTTLAAAAGLTGPGIIECVEGAIGLRPTATSTVACLASNGNGLCLGNSLPSACQALQGLTGTALLAAIPRCQTALGAYSALAVNVLNTATITATTSGAALLSALQAALNKFCLTALPSVCDNIGTVTGLAVAVPLGLCETALGPLGTRAVAVCVANGVNAATNGATVEACIRASLGVTS